MSSPTDRQLEIMRHALGADSRTPGHRNYYCTEEGDPELEAMVEAGYMKRRHTINEGSDRYYSVTENWCKAFGIKVLR